MLVRSVHHCNAHERHPFGEGRLLCFAKDRANPDANPTSTNPTRDDPDAQPTARDSVPDHGHPADATPNSTHPEKLNHPADAQEDEENGASPAVAGGQQQTHRQAQETVAGGDEHAQETPRISAREAIAEAHKLRADMEAMHELMKEVDSEAKQILKGKSLDRWIADERFFATEMIHLEDLIQHLEKIEHWESGAMSPWDLHRFFAKNLEDEETAALIEEKIDASKGKVLPSQDPSANGTLEELTQRDGAFWQEGNIPDVHRNKNWPMYPVSTQRAVIENINQYIDMQGLLGQLRDRVNAYRNAQSGSRAGEFINEVKKFMMKTEREHHPPEHHHDKKGVLANLGIDLEFTSVMDVWNAAQSWWESVQEGWHTKEQLRIAKIARKFGKATSWIPGFEEVSEELDIHLDRKNEEISDNYMKYLKSANFSYTPLMRILHHNAHDPHRAKAILEFAAEKGYIYRVSEAWTSVKSSNDRRILGYKLGDLVGPLWNNDEGRVHLFYKGLLSAQRDGENKQISSGKEQAMSREHIDLIIQDFEQELKGFNLYKIVGMAEVAMARGKIGEVSGWIATTFLAALREKPELRRACPASLLEKLGGCAFGHPGFTAQWIKLGKDDIAGKWGERPLEKEEAEAVFPKAHFLTRAIAQIEKRVKNAKPGIERYGKEGLNRIVARVFATQTVDMSEYGGTGFISIFEDEFKSYRDQCQGRKYEFGVMIEKADPDFVIQESEVILLPTAAVLSILEIGSNGDFRHGDKGTYFLRQCLDKYSTLNHTPNMEGAAENFRGEMSVKLRDWLKEALNKSTSSSIHTKETEAKEGGIVPVIKTLIERGLMDGEMRGSAEALVRQAITRNWAGLRFAKGLYDQLHGDGAADQLAAQNRVQTPQQQGQPAGGQQAQRRNRGAPGSVQGQQAA
jgi:hypothetical protein